MVTRRSHVSWWRRASSWRAAPRCRLGGLLTKAQVAAHGIDHQLVLGGAFGASGRVPARVHHFDLALHPCLALQLGQLVEGDGRPAGATRRGAGQHQPPHPLGVPDGELLGHHAPEGDAHDEAAVPAASRQEGGGIVAVVGHRVRAPRGCWSAPARVGRRPGSRNGSRAACRRCEAGSAGHPRFPK